MCWEGVHFILGEVEVSKFRRAIALENISNDKFHVLGRIEDVVVNGKYRGKQLGQLLVETLILLSESVGCVETSLECKDHLIKFYARYGFVLQDGLKYTTKRIAHWFWRGFLKFFLVS